MLRRVLLLASLVALTLAAGYDHVPQATCKPETETIVVTTTSVQVDYGQATQYNTQYNHQTLDVTSVILIPSTLTQTVQRTVYPQPVFVTRTNFFTVTVYQAQHMTSWATAVATETSRILATVVDVLDLTITQTAIVAQPVTQTLTLSNVETIFDTVTTTSTFSAFVTTTTLKPFFVTKTDYNTYFQFSTQTVTTTSTSTVEATVTITDRQYVTKCFEPMVSYDH